MRQLALPARAAPFHAVSRAGLSTVTMIYAGRWIAAGSQFSYSRRKSRVNGKLALRSTGSGSIRPGVWPMAKKRASRRPSAS